MANNDVVLRAESVSVSYGRILALQPLSFDLHNGGLVLILGPNGAGKTTLVKALAGAVRLRSGRVWVDGQDVTWLPAFRRVKRGVSLVPEGRGTLPGLSVHDNLELGWHAAPRDRRGSKHEDVQNVIQLFPILGQRMDQDCSTLSGGEMQMLAIARALLSRPRVLLLDEPSLGLAPQAIARVYRTLAQLNADRLAMVLVEQKAVPLERPPDTTVVLQSGRVVYQESGEKPSEEQMAALYLGGMAS